MTARIEDPIRRAWRDENERLTDEYIARGGEIQVIPMRCVAPPSKAWIADNGGCYTPWGWVFGEYEQPAYATLWALGDGGYYTPTSRPRGDY
jgi:hypothetical protein